MISAHDSCLNVMNIRVLRAKILQSEFSIWVFSMISQFMTFRFWSNTWNTPWVACTKPIDIYQALHSKNRVYYLNILFDKFHTFQLIPLKDYLKQLFCFVFYVFKAISWCQVLVAVWQLKNGQHPESIERVNTSMTNCIIRKINMPFSNSKSVFLLCLCQ